MATFDNPLLDGIYKEISVGYYLQNSCNVTIQILENIIQHIRSCSLVKGCEGNMNSMAISDTDLNANPSSQHKDGGGFGQDMILPYQLLSRIYEIIHTILGKNLLYVSLLLCNRALISMLNALYI